ncbi:MAG: metallophosphoesterase, partial [Pseudomonadota bacterium]
MSNAPINCRNDRPRKRLRILATTDVHGNLLGFDYAVDMPDGSHGLAGLIPIIQTARADCDASVLLDNGDLLQGSALIDTAADHARDEAAANPVIQLMNRIGYDAMGLGNHDFDHGPGFLN